MDREIRIRIAPDGKVEIDSTIFKDCTEVANQLSKVIGKVEDFTVKDEHEPIDLDERIKIETEK